HCLVRCPVPIRWLAAARRSAPGCCPGPVVLADPAPDPGLAVLVDLALDLGLAVPVGLGPDLVVLAGPEPDPGLPALVVLAPGLGRAAPALPTPDPCPADLIVLAAGGVPGPGLDPRPAPAHHPARRADACVRPSTRGRARDHASCRRPVIAGAVRCR